MSMYSPMAPSYSAYPGYSAYPSSSMPSVSQYTGLDPRFLGAPAASSALINATLYGAAGIMTPINIGAFYTGIPPLFGGNAFQGFPTTPYNMFAAQPYMTSPFNGGNAFGAGNQAINPFTLGNQFGVIPGQSYNAYGGQQYGSPYGSYGAQQSYNPFGGYSSGNQSFGNPFAMGGNFAVNSFLPQQNPYGFGVFM